MNRIILDNSGYTPLEIAEITGGSIIRNNGGRINAVSTDSRDC